MLRINPHYWEQKREQERIDRIKFGRERWEVELDNPESHPVVPFVTLSENITLQQLDQVKAQIIFLEKKLNSVYDKQFQVSKKESFVPF